MEATTLYIPPKKESFNVKPLDQAYFVLNEILNEYSRTHHLDEADFSHLKNLIKNIYLTKKVEYFTKYKIGNLLGHINLFLDYSSNPTLNTNENVKKSYNAVYLKHLEELVNE
jgi:hypothetical protein